MDPIDTELEAERKITKGHLRPMGRIVSGYSPTRNVFGGIVYESGPKGIVWHLTQLFLSGEIWGVDARSLNGEFMRDITGGKYPPYIASKYIEDVFASALEGYMIFAQSHLRLPLPLRIEAGMIGVKGYPIAVDVSGLRGKALHDRVNWQGEVASYDIKAAVILEPLLKRVWANCGIERRPSE